MRLPSLPLLRQQVHLAALQLRVHSSVRHKASLSKVVRCGEPQMAGVRVLEAPAHDALLSSTAQAQPRLVSSLAVLESKLHIAGTRAAGSKNKAAVLAHSLGGLTAPARRTPLSPPAPSARAHSHRTVTATWHLLACKQALGACTACLATCTPQ